MPENAGRLIRSSQETLSLFALYKRANMRAAQLSYAERFTI